jgi:hypothetical protein
MSDSSTYRTRNLSALFSQHSVVGSKPRIPSYGLSFDTRDRLKGRIFSALSTEMDGRRSTQPGLWRSEERHIKECDQRRTHLRMALATPIQLVIPQVSCVICLFFLICFKDHRIRGSVCWVRIWDQRLDMIIIILPSIGRM